MFKCRERRYKRIRQQHKDKDSLDYEPVPNRLSNEDFFQKHGIEVTQA